MHLGHQQRSEIRAMSLDEFAIEVLELQDWVSHYNGGDEPADPAVTGDW